VADRRRYQPKKIGGRGAHARFQKPYHWKTSPDIFVRVCFESKMGRFYKVKYILPQGFGFFLINILNS